MIDQQMDEQLRRLTRALVDSSPEPPALTAGAVRRTDLRVRASAVGFAVALAIGAVTLLVVAQWRSGSDDPTAPAEGDSTETPVAQVTDSSEIPQLLPLTAVSSPLQNGANPLLAASGDVLFAAASIPNPDFWDERVWRSTDSGATWAEVLAVRAEGIIVDLAASESEVTVLISGHVVPGPSILYRSVDGGESWEGLAIPVRDEAIDMSVSAIAVGDVTTVVGASWVDRIEESFNDGKVIVGTQVGLVAHAWHLDGDRFTGASDIAVNGRVYDVVWNGSLFVAVGRIQQGTTNADRQDLRAIWTSSDAITWKAAVLPDIPDDVWLKGDDFNFVAASADGTTIAMARAGDSSIPFGSPDYPGTAVFGTTDGATWKLTYLPDLSLHNVIGTPWGFVAGAIEEVSDDGNRDTEDEYLLFLVVSADGETWDIAGPISGFTSRGVSTTDRIYLSGSSPNGDNSIWMTLPNAAPAGTQVPADTASTQPPTAHYAVELAGWVINSASQRSDGSTYIQIVNTDPEDVEHPEFAIITGPEAAAVHKQITDGVLPSLDTRSVQGTTATTFRLRQGGSFDLLWVDNDGAPVIVEFTKVKDGDVERILSALQPMTDEEWAARSIDFSTTTSSVAAPTGSG